jgi:hypothetical protein
VRQRGDLGRQTHLRHRLGDVRLPRGGADEPGTETVGLTELEADLVDGLAIARRAALRAPRIAHALLVGGEPVGGAGGELPENRGVLVAHAVELLAPLHGRGAGGETHLLVDHAQVAFVVDETFVGGDLRVDADPEADVALELGRPDDAVLGR